MQIQEFDKFTEACSLMLIRKVKVNIWPSIHSLHQQTISFLVGTSSAKKEKKTLGEVMKVIITRSTVFATLKIQLIRCVS